METDFTVPDTRLQAGLHIGAMRLTLTLTTVHLRNRHRQRTGHVLIQRTPNAVGAHLHCYALAVLPCVDDVWRTPSRECPYIVPREIRDTRTARTEERIVNSDQSSWLARVIERFYS